MGKHPMHLNKEPGNPGTPFPVQGKDSGFSAALFTGYCIRAFILFPFLYGRVPVSQRGFTLSTTRTGNLTDNDPGFAVLIGVVNMVKIRLAYIFISRHNDRRTAHEGEQIKKVFTCMEMHFPGVSKRLSLCKTKRCQ
jgi:hypothetical protein